MLPVYPDDIFTSFPRCCTISPPSCRTRVVVSFAITVYPIGIHGQANNFMNLIQQDILCDIIPYASHHLFIYFIKHLPFSVGSKVDKSKHDVHENGNEMDLLVGIEIIWGCFIYPDSHTDPYILL